MLRATVAGLACFVSAATAGCGGVALRSDPHPLLDTLVTKISAPTLGGGQVMIPSRGHVTVVEFWAPSCRPCMPQLRALQSLMERPPKSVVIVGVVDDSHPGRVGRSLASVGATFQNVIGEYAVLIQRRFGIRTVPTMLVFDRDGRLRFVSHSALDPSDLADKVSAFVESVN